MSIFSADGYIDIIEDAAASAGTIFQMFEQPHSIIFNTFVFIVFTVIFLSQFVKWWQDIYGNEDNQSKSEALTSGALILVLMTPATTESGNTVSVSYKYGAELITYTIETYTRAINTFFNRVISDDNNSKSSFIKVYQKSKIQYLANELNIPNVKRAYDDYRYVCRNDIYENNKLTYEEKEDFGHYGSTDFGAYSTIKEMLTVRRANRIIEAKTQFNISKFSNDQSNLAIDKLGINRGKEIDRSVIDAAYSPDKIKDVDYILDIIADETLTLEPRHPAAYQIPNGSYIWQGIARNEYNINIDLTNTPKYLKDTSVTAFKNATPKYEIISSDVAEEMGDFFKEGYEEYTNWIEGQINKKGIDPIIRADLERDGYPLGQKSQNTPLQLVPIDCVSYAMISNIIQGQIGYGIGHSSVMSLDGDYNNHEVTDNTNFAARMAVVGLAQKALFTSYREPDERKMEGSLFGGSDSVLIVTDSIRAGGSTLIEAVNKMEEGTQLDQSVPVFFYGMIMIAAFVLASLPIIIAAGGIGGFPIGIIVEATKLCIFVTLSLIIAQTGILFIDYNMIQTTNDYLAIHSMTGSHLGADYDIGSDTMGTKSLAAIVLAASESTKYTIILGPIIAYGVVYDYKTLFASAGFSSSLGNANSKTSDIAFDQTKKSVKDMSS